MELRRVGAGSFRIKTPNNTNNDDPFEWRFNLPFLVDDETTPRAGVVPYRKRKNIKCSAKMLEIEEPFPNRRKKKQNKTINGLAVAREK